MADHASPLGATADPAAIFSGLSAEERGVLDAADRFARQELYPLARRMDDEEWWPAHAMALCGRNGFCGVTVPPELGGAGMDLFASALVAQAFSRWNHAFGLSWMAHENLCLNNILRNASNAQRARYVPGLARGELTGALGLTEPGAGSDALGAMRTTARREGDHYLLNGSKLYITNGPVADVLLVYAKTDPTRTRARRASRPSSSRRTFRASAWRRSWSRWAFAAARPASWSSRTAACRWPTGWAKKTAVCGCS